MHSWGRRLPVVIVGIGLLLAAGCDSPTNEPIFPQPAAPSAEPARKLDRSIRVLLADEIGGCDLIVPGEFDLLDADRRTPLVQGTSTTTAHLTVDFSAGSIAMAELQRSFDVQAVEIVPLGSSPISMNVDGESRDFCGSFCVYRRSDKLGSVVNTLDVEEYLISVVAAETPATFHPEAFRAQAIASRTYAWYQKKTAPPDRRWDLMATEGSQVYTGLPRGAARRLAAAAVESTSGVVCTWESPQGERIFCTYFSSTCGGHTQATGPVKNEQTIPPLAGSMKCDYCTHSPWFTWGPAKLTKRTVTDRLRQKYPRFREIGPIEEIKVVDETPYGRPVRFRLADSRGRGIELEAENFRLTVDPTGRILRSTFFKVRAEAARFVFAEGRGFGHGLGLCQYGADGMASSGGNAAYILKYYYPHSRLKRAY